MLQKCSPTLILVPPEDAKCTQFSEQKTSGGMDISLIINYMITFMSYYNYLQFARFVVLPWRVHQAFDLDIKSLVTILWTVL
jgi:hypothetical protein